MHEFEEIYSEYYMRIFAFLYKLCGDKQLCEELTQESFYQAYKSFHRYNGKCDMFTWLAAVSKNTYYKHLRKNKHGNISLEVLDTGMFCDTGNHPESDVLEKEQREILNRAINKLSDKYRDVAVLRIYADLPFSKIASLLKINENSAKVIFYRAKNMIREDLDNENKL